MTPPHPERTPATSPATPTWAPQAIPFARAAPQAPADDFCAWWEVTGHTRLHLTGDLDLMTAPALALAVLAHQAVPTGLGAEQRQVRIELSGLRFLDLSGLTTLHEGAEHLTRLGWQVRLRSPQPQPRWLLLYASLAGWLPPGLLSGTGWGPEPLAAGTPRCATTGLRPRTRRGAAAGPRVPAQAGPQ